MNITNYFFDGAAVTAAYVIQGTTVPANTKRKITAAVVSNNTGTARTFAAQVSGGGGAPLTVIPTRTIDPGESYLCPALIGRGMNATGYLQVIADAAGLEFKYEAINITNG